MKFCTLIVIKVLLKFEPMHVHSIIKKLKLFFKNFLLDVICQDVSYFLYEL